MSLWLERFPDAGPDSFLFPSHKIGLAGNSRSPVLYGADLSQPMGSWRKAWRIACKAAGTRYRPHDMRHTFISRLAENPNVSEQTIRALGGRVSRQMLERYSHIRSQAKQAAIQALEQGAIEPDLQATGHKIGQFRAVRHSRLANGETPFRARDSLSIFSFFAGEGSALGQ
jgi:integrase